MRRAYTIICALICANIAQAQTPDQTRLTGQNCAIKRSFDHSPVTQQDGQRAAFVNPTSSYPHGALGDDVEAGGFIVSLPWDASRCDRVLAPDNSVFEDVAPRLIDMNNDGLNEVVVVHSDFKLGARLAIYGYAKEGAGKIKLIAATPYIGRRFRWLAPIGAADFDGDGAMDIAFIDRPHLAKTLQIWSLKGRKFSKIAEAPDLTNHRIGETTISGGIRHCTGASPEIITVDGGWRDVISTRFNGAELERGILSKYTPHALIAALKCS
ncbi:hypothetical protein GCM10007939_08740 [Amylibacter marinus]|uniref:Repeat domain-containing protein n=1 Tax=Amylibacter marinus TaxID=1475483 RepID=A0ABQ5VT94_9RHOB|nr:VCBS repeat-containing protein [Amylibacter marinus]GLQ34591.1 hypothetical protein GCM10007939_08740 [Amylibacter marinus]